MNELIEGIQILFGYELLAPTDRVAAVRMVDDLAEAKGEDAWSYYEQSPGVNLLPRML